VKCGGVLVSERLFQNAVRQIDLGSIRVAEQRKLHSFRPTPRDEARVGATLEWLLAGLPWMCAAQLGFVDRPVALTLTGPGGGTWTIAPGGDAGRVTVSDGADAAAVATITSDAHDFVAWSTHRRPWSECVTIEGDADYAVRVLDAIRPI